MRIVAKPLGTDYFPIFLFRSLVLVVRAELLMNLRKRILFSSTAQNSIVADAGKTFWENVQGKPADEFVDLKGK